jgi:hypothetical protein
MTLEIKVLAWDRQKNMILYIPVMNFYYNLFSCIYFEKELHVLRVTTEG